MNKSKFQNHHLSNIAIAAFCFIVAPIQSFAAEHATANYKEDWQVSDKPVAIQKTDAVVAANDPADEDPEIRRQRAIERMSGGANTEQPEPPRKKEKKYSETFFPAVRWSFDIDTKAGYEKYGILYYSAMPIFIPLLTYASVFGTYFDITSSPTTSYNLTQVQNEASLRPSTWGKPNSMIAKASQLIRENNFQTDQRLILADK